MIFSIKNSSIEDSKSNAIKVRCPSCRQRGTLDVLMQHDLIVTTRSESRIVLGQRRCPDPDCRAHIFFALDKGTGRVLTSYPAERIDFDPTDIPANVLSSFEEAITCHANNCDVAAAIMVRKTLEEICRERGASGANLKQKLEALRTK